jgi:hypothetical protein
MNPVIEYDPCEIKVVYSFHYQEKGHVGVGFPLSESFKTIKEACEYIANHEKKNEMKYISIATGFIVNKKYDEYTRGTCEQLTIFEYNILDKDECVNCGYCELETLIPNKNINK